MIANIFKMTANLSTVVLFQIACLFVICSSLKEYAFVKEGKDAPPKAQYDYIIVGGGTAGCPLAATLSQNFSVLLLERGGSPRGNINVSRIENFHVTLADTSPSSASQAFISEDGVFNARGRVLGGSSAINAGFYSRASLDYVKRAGWDGELVNESYPWVEKLVAHRPSLTPWQSAVRDGLLEVGLSPDNGFTFDHLYGTKEGGTTFNKDGYRSTSADLLQYANPHKLTVLLHATVQRVLFTTIKQDAGKRSKSNPMGRGVLYRDANGVEHEAYLKDKVGGEIIISAGSLGSAQLLMLGGIGPAEHLRSMGIAVVLDQPGVGQHMADNAMNAIFVPTPYPMDKSLIQVAGITKFGVFIEASGGFGTTPDSIHVKHGTMAAQGAVAEESFSGGFILEKIMGPLSRGHLTLKNTNVEDNPSVTFNYFQHRRDLRRCVQGIALIEKVVKSRHFSKFMNPNMSLEHLRNLSIRFDVNLIPKHANCTASRKEFCKETVNTLWHYHGGCQVGRVVDQNYRVIGVDSLRIIDGSTFDLSPGTNPQATVMMLGRYMGVTILRERLGKAAMV